MGEVMLLRVIVKNLAKIVDHSPLHLDYIKNKNTLVCEDFIQSSFFYP